MRQRDAVSARQRLTPFSSRRQLPVLRTLDPQIPTLPIFIGLLYPFSDKLQQKNREATGCKSSRWLT